MTKLQPTPRKIPAALVQETAQRGFFNDLTKSLYQIFDYLNKGTDTPATDPGWSTSSTVDMNTPDGYMKFVIEGQEVVVPFWNT